MSATRPNGRGIVSDAGKCRASVNNASGGPEIIINEFHTRIDEF
jgi:hypothetical protein